MVDESYLLLAGGVGAAKFIDGLAQIISQRSIKIIVNTGDDINLFGLQICPDIDIITYTLANLVDNEKGWGYKNESFNCLSVLNHFYEYKWFNAGDKDLATHIYRTDLLNQQYNKDEVTSIICRKLGVEAEIIPMCNQSVATYIETDTKKMHFEEYYIKYKCEPGIRNVKFRGIEKAQIINRIKNYMNNAQKIILCPSNPIVSIGTILSIPGMKELLKTYKNKVYGISPIIQGAPIKGPADKLMRWKGLEVSPVGVASFYKEFLGHFIIDKKDKGLVQSIENLGINCYTFDTLMKNIEKKKKLAKFVINLN
ncbi:MAG: 2-phospho-L-lactate transferase [Candidatus Lokiarchaeota archaeon]|nr:2-phospho-L-lactate transferase [Candidatus Lokiarchaeota archaeon]MBD3201243.1 2-phospho-L-lactate transferase [Candidatus Lokiarchaeota archaeon]